MLVPMAKTLEQILMQSMQLLLPGLSLLLPLTPPLLQLPPTSRLLPSPHLKSIFHGRLQRITWELRAIVYIEAGHRLVPSPLVPLIKTQVSRLLLSIHTPSLPTTRRGM